MSNDKKPEGSTSIDFKDHPIAVDGTKLTELAMREPRVSDQLSVENIKAGPEREVALFANLCEVSPETIGDLTMRQYGRLQAAYSSFMA